MSIQNAWYDKHVSLLFFWWKVVNNCQSSPIKNDMSGWVKVAEEGKTTKRGGGGKTPLTTKQKNTFFHQRKKSTKKYEPLRSRGSGGGGGVRT